MTANPVSGVTRAKEPRNKWRILTPTEVRQVEQAFATLIAASEANDGCGVSRHVSSSCS
jgi:hypothetical protein